MKKRMPAACCADWRNVIFRQALMPMEAAVLPACERRRYGTLKMVPRAYEALGRLNGQRAKI